MAAVGVKWRGLAALGVAASTALADETPSADRIKAAAEEFDAGRRAYNAKDYEGAATHFENADRDAPAPEAVRNAIRARSDAKQSARAATLSAAALSRYPNDKVTSKLAKQVLSASEKQLHKLQVQCTPACTLLLDGKLAPLPEATSLVVYLDPGSHRVSAGWSDDRHREQSVEAQAGKDSSLRFEAPPRPQPPPKETATATASAAPTAVEPPPPSGKLPPLVFYSAAGVTAVLGGLTIWSTLDMRSDPGREKVRRDCAGKTASCPTYQDALSKQSRTNVLLAVTGGVAVATGVIAYFTDWAGRPAASPESAARRAVRPSLAVGGGLYLGAEGEF